MRPERARIAVSSETLWSAASDTPPTEIILPRCAVSRWFFQPATSLATGFARFPNSQTAAFISGESAPHGWSLFSIEPGNRDAHDDLADARAALFSGVLLSVRRGHQLAPLIEALRPLRLSGALRSTVHIANDYKVLSGLQQYPWEETGGSVPLRADVMLELRRRLKFGAWSGFGRSVRHAPPGCRSAPAMMREALKGKVDRLQFLDDRMLGLRVPLCQALSTSDWLGSCAARWIWFVRFSAC